MNVQQFKAVAIGRLPDVAGVYALCDLDNVPIYVGQAALSKDTSIRKRVQRHLTSARSDVVANRQIDVWEIAFVWAWATDDAESRTELESFLFHQFNDQAPLVNGAIPPRQVALSFPMPERVEVQVMDQAVVLARREPELRFPRLIQHCNQLVDYVLNTQDKPHLHRALQVYFSRLNRYFHEFLDSRGEEDTEDSRADS